VADQRRNSRFKRGIATCPSLSQRDSSEVKISAIFELIQAPNDLSRDESDSYSTIDHGLKPMMDIRSYNRPPSVGNGKMNTRTRLQRGSRSHPLERIGSVRGTEAEAFMMVRRSKIRSEDGTGVVESSRAQGTAGSSGPRNGKLG